MTTDTTTNSPVTVLGLGSMGSALAAALLKAGHPTTVWNRSPGKADDLVAAGAVRAASVTDAIKASPLVIACLLDYPVVEELLAPAADALTGRDLVNLTNGTPDQARALAARLDARGAWYVDGGIMAIPRLIGTPEGFILYSGSRETFDRARPALDRLGGAHYLGGDAGLASLYDLALLSAMYGMASGVRHAITMVGEERAAEFGSAYLAPWLQAMAAPIGQGAAEDEEASPLGMQAVGMSNIVEASRGEGVPNVLLSHLLIAMQDIVDAGHDDLLPPLIDQIRKAG
ncbi:NAD(P)-dependent oxidoreductase [Actinomadura rugatobispora]|uniref:NAD(P)-dependent oxidoreductase n=1 Tax=Actinomadura rugatobispora TaxID=1994 RepID=A0ABW0ZQF7_9ACTN|nr:NAD(P)-dependent oxidoreductase [Actinomadura rugatobispora]